MGGKEDHGGGGWKLLAKAGSMMRLVLVAEEGAGSGCTFTMSEKLLHVKIGMALSVSAHHCDETWLSDKDFSEDIHALQFSLLILAIYFFLSIFCPVIHTIFSCPYIGTLHCSVATPHCCSVPCGVTGKLW